MPPAEDTSNVETGMPVEAVLTPDGDQQKDDAENARSYGFCSWPGGWTIVDFGTHETPYEIIGDSAYSYLLVKNLWAIVLALAIVAFQISLFWFLWQDNDTKQTTTLTDTERVRGMVYAMILLALRLLPHIGQAFTLMWIGLGGDKNKKYTGRQRFLLILIGVCDLVVSGWCVAIGIRASNNSGTTLTRIITQAVVALFVESVDELFLTFLRYYSNPNWFHYYKAELEQEFGPTKKLELSEDEIKSLKEQLKTE